MAARENKEDIFRRLIEKYKANIQYKNDQQKTHWPWLPKIQPTQELDLKENIWCQFGQRWGKVDNIRCQCDGDILLDILNDCKADFHVKDKNRMSAMHQASNHNRPDMGKCVIENLVQNWLRCTLFQRTKLLTHA